MVTSRQRPGSTRDSGTPPAPFPERVALREAHLRFEMGRWRGDRLEPTLRTEVEALVDWLDAVRVADVLPPAETADLTALVIDDLDVTEELVGLAVDVLLAARAVTLESDTTLADLADREDVHDVVRVAVGIPDLRTRAVEALTDNPAYHELVAHVLYHGVKAFVLSENVLARKVPGAQSLIKFGQRSLNTAAPGLEEGVDRRLRRFVQGQIGETLSDSRRFIEHYLTSDAAHEFVDTVFESMGPTRLAEAAEVVADDDVEVLTRAMTPMVDHAIRSGLAGRLVAPTIERVLTAYADHTVTTLLEELGFNRTLLIDQLTGAARPLATHAVDSGHLEERLRARLDAFYTDGLHAMAGSAGLNSDEHRQLGELLDKLLR